jgi:hypothetical protein
MTGKQLLNDKKTKGRLVRETKESNNESFSKPPIDELMEETEQSLQAAMSKFGVKVPTLAEVKSKKEKIQTRRRRRFCRRKFSRRM